MKNFFIGLFILLSISVFSNSMLSQISVVESGGMGVFKEYGIFRETSDEFAIIPGLEQGLIPQGMAYMEEKNWFALSYYQSGSYSVLSFVDALTGKMVKSLIVCNEDGSYYTGHAGGVAISHQNLWISSGGFIRKIPLKDVYEKEDREKIKIVSKFNSGTNASFTTFSNGVLWVGEFFHEPNYLTDRKRYVKISFFEKNHGWITGFRLDEETDELATREIVNESTPVIPDYILSIPDIVQGIAFSENNEVVLSLSYGRKNDSTLQIYSGIDLNKEHKLIEVEGEQIPAWILCSKNLIYKLTTFPMSENIVIKDSALYTLYESAAEKYRPNTKYPAEHIWKTDLKKLDY